MSVFKNEQTQPREPISLRGESKSVSWAADPCINFTPGDGAMTELLFATERRKITDPEGEGM